MSGTVMMFGLGDLGGWVLEFLARSPGVNTIITCDKNEDWGFMKTECAAIGAGQQGYSKVIKFERCDVKDVDATAELLKKYNPDVIYSALTLLGWLELRGVIHAFGAEKYYKVSACTASMQALLLSKVMKARKKAGIVAPVVNNSYPDVVNPVLARNGLGPLVGAGNMDLVVGEVRRKISIAENVPISAVTVYLIASHAAVVQGTRTGVPFFFKAMVGDRDITQKFDVDSLLSDSPLLNSPVEKSSWLNHPTVAASAVKNILAILNDTNEFAHSPGPNGLPGGYPFRIGSNGINIVLPEGISLEEAVEINLKGLKYDGVEEIKQDGTVVFTDEARKNQKEFFGVDLREHRFADLDEIANELLAAGRKLVAKYRS